MQNKGDFIGLYLPENLWHCKLFLYFNFSMDKVSVVNVEPKELSKITYLLINLQLVLQEERWVNWFETKSAFYSCCSRSFKMEKLKEVWIWG